MFIGSSAGLPKFMNILGENLNGVLSTNEFLTRVNFMKDYLDNYEIPIKVGKKVVVISDVNITMDSIRTVKRLRAEAPLLL